jgi:hypothetical protein
MPIELFYSYAREDRELRDQLDRQLSTLRREGLIVGWHDGMIGAGEEWLEEIKEQLDSAQLILLLVSSDFLASEFIYRVELQRALERHQSGEAIVVPIILRSSDWKNAPFGHLNALPRDGRPVTSWPDRDAAFYDIVLGLREVITRLGKRVPKRTGDAKRAVPAERVMDAAIASHLVQGQSTELDVLIRLPNSPGLKHMLAEDGAADAAPDDAREKRFELTFPVGDDGRPEPRAAWVTVIVPKPDFELRGHRKDFLIHPTRDSERLTFFLTPKRTGQLKVLVELHWNDVLQAPRRLVTECVANASLLPPRPRRDIVHMPIGVVEDERQGAGGSNVRAGRVEPGGLAEGGHRSGHARDPHGIGATTPGPVYAQAVDSQPAARALTRRGAFPGIAGILGVGIALGGYGTYQQLTHVVAPVPPDPKTIPVTATGRPFATLIGLAERRSSEPAPDSFCDAILAELHLDIEAGPYRHRAGSEGWAHECDLVDPLSKPMAERADIVARSLGAWREHSGPDGDPPEEEWMWSLKELDANLALSQFRLVAYVAGGPKEMRVIASYGKDNYCAGERKLACGSWGREKEGNSFLFIFADGEKPWFELPPTLAGSLLRLDETIRRDWSREGARLALNGPGGICGRFSHEHDEGPPRLELWPVPESAAKDAARAGSTDATDWACIRSKGPVPPGAEVLYRD